MFSGNCNHHKFNGSQQSGNQSVLVCNLKHLGRGEYEECVGKPSLDLLHCSSTIVPRLQRKSYRTDYGDLCSKLSPTNEITDDRKDFGDETFQVFFSGNKN